MVDVRQKKLSGHIANVIKILSDIVIYGVFLISVRYLKKYG